MQGFFNLVEGIFVVAKRYNSSSATKHVSHGHGLVEVTFTLNLHDGNIICISGSDGGAGEGRFSYADMMYQTCRREEWRREEDENNKESIYTEFDE